MEAAADVAGEFVIVSGRLVEFTWRISGTVFDDGGGASEEDEDECKDP